MDGTVRLREHIQQLLTIMEQLREDHRVHNKRFTLDGRLVGDIGEVLVASHYEVRLFDKLQRHHDGETPDGRRVQIKATMQGSLTFPVDHVPDYYLGIRIRPDGLFDEIFNGPGTVARLSVQNRKPTKTNLHSVPISTLAALSRSVPASERIAVRAASRVTLRVGI